jgi:hypothetical protein
MWQIYLRKDIAYVPTVAQTEAGYYLDIEPVAAVPAADSAAFTGALKQVMIRGNPKIPTPTRATFPKPVVLKHANVRTWADFERTASHWTITHRDNSYKIAGSRRRPDMGWEEDPSQIETLPGDSSVEEVARRVFSVMQSTT